MFTKEWLVLITVNKHFIHSYFYTFTQSYLLDESLPPGNLFSMNFYLSLKAWLKWQYPLKASPYHFT